MKYTSFYIKNRYKISAYIIKMISSFEKEIGKSK